MRIYKKLFSRLALFLLCIVCLLADAPKVRAADVLFCSANMNICLRKPPSACRENIARICSWSFCGMMLRQGLLCANYNVRSKIMGIA